MNEMINKFLLVGDKFMPELHLKQPRFIVLLDHLLKIQSEFFLIKSLQVAVLIYH